MSLTRVFWRGTGSNDEYSVASGEVANIFGMKGSDTITGNVGNDVIYGGSGNDSLDGGGGADVLFGDIGNDTLKGGEGNDSMHGGAGNDTFVYTSSDNSDGSDTIDGDAGTDVADYSAVENFQLSVGTTYISFGVGSIGASDIVYGEAGIGYEIETVIAGEGENDIFFVSGDEDGFTIDLSKALQKVSGLLELKTVSGFEHVTGGNGNDAITGSSGDNSLDGGGGNDTIYASAGEDTLLGGDGDDTLSFTGKSFTSKEAMTLNLVDGSLGFGDSTVSFEEFEYLVGGKGKADIIDASEVDPDAHPGVTIDLSAGTIALGSTGYASSLSNLQGVTGFEIVYGSDGDDTITGDKGNNTIYGNFGDDVLYGGSGNDVFYQGWSDEHGNNDDTIDGGAGTDIVYVTMTDVDEEDLEAIQFSTAEEDGFNYLEYGDYEQMVAGIEKLVLVDSGTEDILNFDGTTSNLTVTLASGSIKGLSKTAPNALTSATGFEYCYGGDGNDKITAGDKTSAAVANDLSGGAGNDTLDGGYGNDTLWGGTGNDSILGGDGDDELNGSGGTDKLLGGKGDDTYLFTVSEFGTATIYDADGTDTIDLSTLVSNGNSLIFELVDGSTDKDTNKLDALKISGDEGTIIIDGFFNNTITSDDFDLADLIAGMGQIESFMFASHTFDLADIKEALMGSA